MVIIALRGVAGLAGVLAYYIAFFMYEDEEGKWQSRIENVWVSAHDRERESGARFAALLGKVAALVTRLFNSIFGRRLVSARFVGTSICGSVAMNFLFSSLFILMGRPFGLFVKQPSPVDLVTLRYIGLFLLVAGVLFSFLAILPALWHSRWAVALSSFPVIFFFFDLVLLARFHVLKAKHSAFFLGLVLSLLSNVLLLTLVRFTTRWIAAKASASRTVLAILIQVSIVYLLVLVPLAIPAALEGVYDFRQSVTLMALVVMGGLNIFTAISSSAFLLALLLMLLHRALWPLLGRILYPLARHQVIRNRGLIIACGSACLLFAFPLLNGPTRAFVEWLAK